MQKDIKNISCVVERQNPNGNELSGEYTRLVGINEDFARTIISGGRGLSFQHCNLVINIQKVEK